MPYIPQIVDTNQRRQKTYGPLQMGWGNTGSNMAASLGGMPAVYNGPQGPVRLRLRTPMPSEDLGNMMYGPRLRTKAGPPSAIPQSPDVWATMVGTQNANAIVPQQSYPIQNALRPTAEDSQWANASLRDIAFEQGRTPENVQGMMAAQANAYQMGDHPMQRGLMPQRSMEEINADIDRNRRLGQSTAYWQSPSGMNRARQFEALAMQRQQQMPPTSPLGPPVPVWLGPRNSRQGVTDIQDVPFDNNQSGYLQPQDAEPGNRYQVKSRTPYEHDLYIDTTDRGTVSLVPRSGWSRPEDQDERMAASRDRRQARRNRLKEARAGYYAAKNSGTVRSTGQTGRRAAVAEDMDGRKVPSLADFAPPPRADANGNPVPPTPEEQTSAAFQWIDAIVDRDMTDAELLKSFQDSGVTMADVRTLLQESRNRKSFWGESRLEQETRRAREQVLERLYKMAEAGNPSREKYPALPSSPVGGYLNPAIVPPTGVM